MELASAERWRRARRWLPLLGIAQVGIALGDLLYVTLGGLRTFGGSSGAMHFHPIGDQSLRWPADLLASGPPLAFFAFAAVEEHRHGREFNEVGQTLSRSGILLGLVWGFASAYLHFSWQGRAGWLAWRLLELASGLLLTAGGWVAWSVKTRGLALGAVVALSLFNGWTDYFGDSLRLQRHRPLGPVVMLDTWWDEDFARESCAQAVRWHEQNTRLTTDTGCAAIPECPEMMTRLHGCGTNPTAGVRQFESDLAIALEVTPGCRGIKVVKFSTPSTGDRAAATAMLAPHWTVLLDFEAGSLKQRWTLQNTSTTVAAEGTADAREIAKSICSVVTGRGPRLAN